MAATGWYPDPGGAPGRFRYWDGDAWSEQTITDPSHAAPPTGQADGDDHPKSSNKGWAVALVVLAMLTIVAVVVLLLTSGIGPGGRGTATEDTRSSRPTVSVWDETSTPTPPTTPPPITETGGQWVDCPWSTGRGITLQPAGRVAAGGLSFALPARYAVLSYMPAPSLLYDSHGVERSIPYGNGFASSIGVGLAANADGFVDISTTANQAMQCWSMTDHPVEAPPEVLIAGDPMTISGHAAWHVRWHITYTKEPIAGEVLDIIAVDMGSGADYLGVFYSCRPVDDPEFEASIALAIDSLTVA